MGVVINNGRGHYVFLILGTSSLDHEEGTNVGPEVQPVGKWLVRLQ